MAQLTELIAKRDKIKCSLTRLKTFYESIVTDDTFTRFTELKLRLSKTSECWADFDSVQFDIELLDTDGSHAEERNSFERDYFELIADINDFISAHENSGYDSVNQSQGKLDDNSSTHSRTRNFHGTLKLPPLNLPSFSGTYSDWLPFYDSFMALIDNNEKLSDIQRFHYLKSALKGEAASVIKSVELTAANYKIALQLLIDRYHDTNAIILRHVKDLFTLPKVTEKSSSLLQSLLDETLKNVRALKALGQPVEYWDTLLVALTTSKFDTDTFESWEEKWSGKLATLKELTTFLEHRCKVLLSCNAFEKGRTHRTISKISSEKSDKFINNKRTSPIGVCLAANGNNSCICCHQQQHPLFLCEKYKALPVKEKIDLVKNSKLCYNCLRPYHSVDKCKSSPCRICHKRHNTSLCLNTASVRPANTSSNAPLVGTSNEPGPSHVLANFQSAESQVLLSTALIKVHNETGNSITCRALLDCASQSSFITSRIVNQLKLIRKEITQPIRGVGSSSIKIESFVEANISSQNNLFNKKLRLLVLEKITDNLPSIQFDNSKIKIPSHIHLADPFYNTSSQIDLLIGNDLFWDLICKGHVKISGSSIHLQNTQLGWIIAGKIGCPTTPNALSCNLTLTHSEINNQLGKFWELEEVPYSSNLTNEEKRCEDYFVSTTRRDESGRYIVKLPFKVDPKYIGDSKPIARKRLHALENRFRNNPALEKGYKEFMTEYQNLNHMVAIDESEITTPYYYIPHHAVFKEDSTTTKLRVVFDASCKSSSNLSLNDTLMVGPIVQSDLFSILTRFRSQKYAFTADLEKMYRQILVDPPDTKLQLILWRQAITEPIQTFKLLTVTYGMACSSYLATRTIMQLATDEGAKYPNASSAIKNDFYVDDYVSGSSSLEEAKQTQKDLIKIFRKGGFRLRKWCSNEPQLLSSLPLEECSSQAHVFDKNAKVKTLGLMWDPTLDNFHFNINPKPDCTSKRSMLSAIAQIFDPLGLIGPIIVTAKIFMQRLWSNNLDWDDQVPDPLLVEWKEYSNTLIDLNELKIPRWILSCNPRTIQLHGFSDASERAYGACVYIKAINEHDEATINLIASKSRVAPLKRISLPRLELCGALLLAHLLDTVKRALNIEIESSFLYTDSTIVLGWIAAPSSHWATFVANRVAKIQELTSEHYWYHINGLENPADLVSRGTTAQELIKSTIWRHGPERLKSNEPPDKSSVDFHELPERRLKCFLLTFTSFVKENNLVSKYSTLSKLVNVVAYCFRYVNNTRIPDSQRNKLPFLKIEERQMALKHLIKIVQSEFFPQESTRLQSKQPLSKGSRLLSLNCFIDSDGIIRVGGRIGKARHLPTNQRHPIVLPPQSMLTKLIILDEHKRNLHAGPQLLLYLIRQNYWPINGLTQVKKVLSTCISCFRQRAQTSQQIMGDLPEQRLQPTRPFFVTGVDYCGPFYIRQNLKRSKVYTKAYASIFVCFSTKAVHIELVEDLTAESFIAALRRFIARRGKPHTIHSDNATNFTKANSDLQELHNLLSSSETRRNIINDLTQHGINWKFIPPQSPHFGGLWEAAVKSAKYHLKRVVGPTKLTFGEMYTILTQVESILNSRPLSPLSNHPRDLQPLTPSHFLIGGVLVAAPDQDLQDVQVSRLSR